MNVLRQLRRPLPLRAMGLVLGVVFVYASLDKIAAPVDFARIVYRYGLVGPGQPLGLTAANLLAVGLPWVELVAGLALIAGVWRREAAATVGLMLVMFIGAIGWTMLMGIDVTNCGCFTVDGAGRETGWLLLATDVGLLAMAGLLALPPAVEPLLAEKTATLTEAAPEALPD
jgi:uncharacterized membrane protein YphA (DoxX/SURF4 family)